MGEPNGTHADIRVIDIDGEPWFPAKDVCDVLGTRNPSHAREYLEDTEVMQIMRSTLRITEVSFPNRGMLCVNESCIHGRQGPSQGCKRPAVAFSCPQGTSAACPSRGPVRATWLRSCRTTPAIFPASCR